MSGYRDIGRRLRRLYRDFAAGFRRFALIGIRHGQRFLPRRRYPTFNFFNLFNLFLTV